MNNALIYQVAVGLLVIFMIAATVFSTKVWRWHHLVCLWLVMLSALWFCYQAALSAKTRVLFTRMHAENEKKLDDVQTKNKRLMYGDLHEILQTDDSLRGLRHKIARSLVDRGRVWRNCAPAGVQADGTITLNLIAAPAVPVVPDPTVAPPAAVPGAVAPGVVAPGAVVDPAAVPAAAPESEKIDPKTVLYAFLEGQGPQLGLPVLYLGEFRVTTSTDTSINVASILALPTRQIPTGNWALYESMPLDGHDAFSEIDAVSDENHIFGAVNEQEVRALMPKWQGQTDELYDAKIREYLRNGTPAADDDPPENIWLQVKFLKDYEIQVDADTAVSMLDNRYFDNTGRAIVASLQQGEPTKFKPNDFGVFHQEFANQLIVQGTAEKVKPIYVRKLHDYWFAFHEISDRMNKVAMETERVQRNMLKIDESNKKLLDQIAYREQEKKKLQEDLANVRIERDAITKYVAGLQNLWTERKQLLSQLYRSNNALADEILELSRQLNQQVKPSDLQSTAMSN